MLIFMLNRWFMGVMVPGKSDIPAQHSRKLLETGKNSVITWWTWSKACSGTLDFPSKFFNTMQANSNWFQKQNDAEICVEIGVMAGLEEALGAQFALLLVCLQILSKMITFGFMLIWQHLPQRKIVEQLKQLEAGKPGNLSYVIKPHAMRNLTQESLFQLFLWGRILWAGSCAEVSQGR